MKKLKVNIKINRKVLDSLIIILVGCILCFRILNSNFNVYFDDGIQHIARAYGTKLGIKEDGLFPNIISSFANGFGYSWNLFYGPLSTYVLLIIDLIFNNLVNSYKLLGFIGLILSGIFMYKLVNSIMKNNNAALLASVLYMTFPYHLTDFFTRNALGEFLSFVFIPLVFLGIYNLFYEENKNSYYITIGAVGLILTHNISTVFIAFFAIFLSIFNLEKLKDKKFYKPLILNIVFIILITSFYWVPLIETQLFTKYQVYEDGMMATNESVSNAGLKLNQFFVTFNDGSYIFELGPHIIMILAFSIMTFRRIDKRLKEMYCFFFISSLLTLWMSTKYFPWGILPEQFCFIQFPWRMLMMSGFFISLVCTINMYTLIRKFNIRDVIIVSVISIYYSVAIFSPAFKNEERINDIADISLGNFSGREVEVINGCGKGEYLPVNAYKNRFYIATREKDIYVLEGKALIENEIADETNYSAKLKTLDAEYTIFELPYIYYPGYEVRLDGMLVDYFETENGFMGIAMRENDDALLSVKYAGTLAMNITMLISSLSIIGFVVIFIRKIKSSKVLKNEEK